LGGKCKITIIFVAFAGSKILSLLNEHSSREVPEASSFNLTHWRNIMPNIGSGSANNYSSEMMQRQQLQQTQQRGIAPQYTKTQIN
jgi:hypothetical protein